MSINERLPPGKVPALIVDQISQLALILTHLVRIPKKPSSQVLMLAMSARVFADYWCNNGPALVTR